MLDPSLTKFEEDFYKGALSKSTTGPESTGYGHPVNQQVRFAEFSTELASVVADVAVRRNAETMTQEQFHNVARSLTLADVGCGTGDLPAMLDQAGIEFGTYAGLDRDKGMIDAATERFKDRPDTYFRVGDANSLDDDFDITACIATLAMKPEDWSLAQSHDYVKDQIEAMMLHTREMCFVTLFSNWKTKTLPTEMNVSPAHMFEWALSRWDRVKLLHSYAPHDFSLVIFPSEGMWWRERG